MPMVATKKIFLEYTQKEINEKEIKMSFKKSNTKEGIKELKDKRDDKEKQSTKDNKLSFPVIPLNVHDLNSPIKRWIQNRIQIYANVQETLDLWAHSLKVKGWKNIVYTNSKRAMLAILLSDKID